MREDDAVSPVIGVILMVAITVILAAVIAAFVLGIGDTDDVAPQTTFDSSFDEDADEITLEIVSGDSLDLTEIEIRGGDDGDWVEPMGTTVDQVSGVGVDELGVGESITMELDTDGLDDFDDTNLVWVGDGEDVIKTLEH